MVTVPVPFIPSHGSDPRRPLFTSLEQLLAIPVRNDADLADLARDGLLIDVMDRLEAKGLKARRTGVYHFSTGADSNNQLTLIPSSDSSKQCSEVSCAVSGTKPRTSTTDHRLLKRLVGSISGPETSSGPSKLVSGGPTVAEQRLRACQASCRERNWSRANAVAR